MKSTESHKETEHEKENSKPNPPNTIREEEKDVKKAKEDTKKEDLIIIGADIGQGKLQRKFEKFRKLRIVIAFNNHRNK